MPTRLPTTVAMVTEQCWQRVPGGSATYVVELSRALADRDDTRLVGVTALHRRGDVPRPGLEPTVDRSAVAPLPRAALYRAWNRVGAPRPEQLARGVDVVHATTWAVPPTRRPLVVTVHDVAFLTEPEHFTARGVGWFRRGLQRVVAEADAVVVPSRATWQECVAAGIEPGRLRLVPHGVRVVRAEPGAVEAFRRRQGLSRPYVLWTGTLEPRKNVGALLTAFERLTAADPGLDLDLVLVGPTGWGDVPRPASDRVRRLGRLSPADLACAYEGARAFCFPSTREGFGMPVLEAMAHGVPVVTSAGTSMAEVAGDDALLADPRDPDAIAAQLLRAVGADHDALAAAGLRRAGERTWAQAAAATVEVYRTAAG
ncbi:glycosyltransferase family 1 protein [uncultured Cellulomonas sp.]|uniref:glycosyltransferase family 4 protein n=1 Tax=uncultured Cellulomonas sp. TaxID=189682 RepID=UPI002610B438|nr:glycosyltransferase family 1 protein [uncultured Cellulomonas sp.]